MNLGKCGERRYKLAISMKARLADANITQRWVLDQLHKRGFAELCESTLSDINRKRYIGRCAAPVLAEEERILAEVANNGI